MECIRIMKEHSPSPWKFDPVKPHKLRSYSPELKHESASIFYIKPGVGHGQYGDEEFDRKILEAAPELFDCLQEMENWDTNNDYKYFHMERVKELLKRIKS